MNSKTVFSVLLLFLYLSIEAQEPGWGVKGGINLSSFGGDTNNSDTRIGLNLGAYYHRVLTGDFAIQPEAALSLEGDDDTSFTNLNLGAMGKFRFEEFMVEFGPQLGLILGDDDLDASATNFSLGIGAGYSFNRQITGGLRYNIGISDVSDDNLGEDTTNSTLSINIFYRL
ncbi:MAG: outer membrane beta-barrel protein [Bacteroidota bacterium]